MALTVTVKGAAFPLVRTTSDEPPDALVFAYGFDAPPSLYPCPVICLTPDAAAAYAAAGGDPLSVDDFMDRRALVVCPERAYVRWQLGWLEGLAQVSAVEPDVFRSALSYIKLPADCLVVSSRLLRAVIERISPSLVVYVGPDVPDEPEPWHSYHLQFLPRLGDRPLVDRLLPLVCQQVGVPYRRQCWLSPAGGGVAPGGAGLSDRVRRTLAPVINFARAGAWRTAGDASLLLWQAGYGVRTVANVERSQDRRVLFVERGRRRPRIRQALPLGHRSVSERLDTALPPGPCTPLSGAQMARLDLIDEWGGVTGAGRVLESRLATYVSRVCPVIADLASRLEPILRQTHVTRVIATNPCSVIEFGCLLAAERVGTIERTLVQHGEHAYSYDAWLVTETQNFDSVAFSDPTLPDDLTAAALDLGCGVPSYHAWAPRLDRLSRLSPGRAPAQGGVVCYLPTFFLGDSCGMGTWGIEDCWYFRWQRALLAVMAGERQVRFLWKALPSSNNVAVDPMADLVAGVPNVAWETAPFPSVISRVGALITDFSSTGLFEGLHVGLPTLALSFSRFEEIRPLARRRLGAVLRTCDHIADAEVAVRQFVTSQAAPTPM